jgi:hypothetical protein
MVTRLLCEVCLVAGQGHKVCTATKREEKGLLGRNSKQEEAFRHAEREAKRGCACAYAHAGAHAHAHAHAHALDHARHRIIVGSDIGDAMLDEFASIFPRQCSVQKDVHGDRKAAEDKEAVLCFGSCLSADVVAFPLSRSRVPVRSRSAILNWPIRRHGFADKDVGRR